jgi:hypothetical protein
MALMLQMLPCRTMLYCSLTGQLMDKSVDAIKKHMKGKKFQYKKGGLQGNVGRAAGVLGLSPQASTQAQRAFF